MNEQLLRYASPAVYGSGAGMWGVAVVAGTHSHIHDRSLAIVALLGLLFVVGVVTCAWYVTPRPTPPELSHVELAALSAASSAPALLFGVLCVPSEELRDLVALSALPLPRFVGDLTCALASAGSAWTLAHLGWRLSRASPRAHRLADQLSVGGAAFAVTFWPVVFAECDGIGWRVF